MSYADVNGLSLYYEEHGSGEPLILLHGGIGVGRHVRRASCRTSRPAGASSRSICRATAARPTSTGRSARRRWPTTSPRSPRTSVSPQIDLMGYSLGGVVALRTAIQHPALVRRLVLISIPFRRDGNHPEVIAAMDQMTPEIAEVMKQSPPYALYSSIAPRPEDWPVLIAKTSDLLKVDYDWTAETAALTAPTMLVFADADSVRPAHIVEFFGLLGGGLRDAGWDNSSRPTARLAILPGTTHYDVFMSPLLAPAVIPFLDAPACPGSAAARDHGCARGALERRRRTRAGGRRRGARAAAGGGDVRPRRGLPDGRDPDRRAVPARARVRRRGHRGRRRGGRCRAGRRRRGPVPDLVRSLRGVRRRSHRELRDRPARLGLRDAAARRAVGRRAGRRPARAVRGRDARPAPGRARSGSRRERRRQRAGRATAPWRRRWRTRPARRCSWSAVGRAASASTRSRARRR